MKESEFQKKLIDELEILFLDCIILKNDPSYIQGIPDLAIFYNNMWAMLECKKSVDAPAQPNQPYYVKKCNRMSFARFIYPENKDSVIKELQYFFMNSIGDKGGCYGV